MMQRRRQQQHQSQRIFTAGEVAEFEYCPLVWWHEQYEPMMEADTEELFAEMVAMEDDHGPQATALPQYQVIEQLLVRRGAFEEGHQQHSEHAAEVTELEEERSGVVDSAGASKKLMLIACALLVLALLLTVASFLLSKLTQYSIAGNILLPPGIGLLLLALALFLLLLNERRHQTRRLIEEHKRALGLPTGELIYEDADGQGEPLSSSEYPMVGKPDYVVQRPDGRAVPIALKLSVQNATTPYSNHVVQIAAYCLILEDYFEVPPTHGILRYANREFTIDYTPALRKKVIRLLSEMESCNQRQPPPLTRQRVSKCRSCIFQPICPVGQSQ